MPFPAKQDRGAQFYARIARGESTVAAGVSRRNRARAKHGDFKKKKKGKTPYAHPYERDR